MERQCGPVGAEVLDWGWMPDKQHAHDLLERLDPNQLAAVVHLLETIVPLEDEPVSDDDRRAVAEADAWLKDHGPIPNEEVLAEFGLSTEDWKRMAQEPDPGADPRG